MRPFLFESLVGFRVAQGQAVTTPRHLGHRDCAVGVDAPQPCKNRLGALAGRQWLVATLPALLVPVVISSKASVLD